MTLDIFRDWISKLERKFASSSRKGLFLVDQCSADIDVAALSAIHLAYLPANTMSVLQPIDQGVIENVKVLYRKHLVEHMILCKDKSSQYEVSLINTVHMLAQAWGRVKNETIANCFRACGFVANSSGKASPCPLAKMRSELENVSFDAPLGDSRFDAVLGDSCFEGYVTVDSSGFVRCIVRPHESVHQIDDECDNESEPQPKTADTAVGLTLTHRCFAWENNAEEALRHVYTLQKLLFTARLAK